MLALKGTPNAEKRLGLILYNYPPGEHNIGNAAYLDTCESLKQILERLRDDGYTVGDIPPNLPDLFLDGGVLNSPQWTAGCDEVLLDEDTYRALLADVPQLVEDIEQQWGPFPGVINTAQGKLRIPCRRFGNILVAIQPARGVHEDQEKLLHDKELAPHHQYAAFYRWITSVTDALVHVGTHGTVEFLRGKEMAISRGCDMDMLLGDSPHFYLYQTGNPSEAMTAKRRSLATTIGYAQPAAEGAGLYGDYVTLRERLDEREEAARLHPQRVAAITKEIVSLVDKCGWADLLAGLDSGEASAVPDCEAIDRRVTAMQRSMIPVGLRVFGRVWSEEERVRLLASMMRFDQGGSPSLNRALATIQGLDYDSLLEESAPELLSLDAAARDLVHDWVVGGTQPGISACPDSLEGHRHRVQALNATLLVDPELDGLMGALAGGFVPPGLAADGLKNPEVFPSGRNLFQFNPLTLPTPSAVARGRIIAQNTLDQYIEAHGEYPDTVGVVLWGFETAKTCGETVGQIFDYLGVRVTTAPGTWFPQVEPIASVELEHPRVDVHVQICGFFRDMFPNLVALIDDAVRAVSDLDEPSNVVRINSVRMEASLLEQGVEEKAAAQLAGARVFGPREGSYGTSLPAMVDTAAWGDEAELGDIYSRDMSYVYGRELSGMRSSELNSLLLAKVDMISQVQDTYSYEITDLDHYFEFFGGFATAVKNQKGSRPHMLATNTAGETIDTGDVGEAIMRGAVTRTFNPVWIDAMLEHDYHGAQHIAERVENQIGLSATTGEVSQWVWHTTAHTFMFDDEMRHRLMDNNPFAAQEIAQRLYEARQRGYWDATPEEVEKLLDLLMEFEDSLEGRGDRHE